VHDNDGDDGLLVCVTVLIWI